MASTIRLSFGTHVRVARQDRDWTQKMLAERAGLSRSLVSAVELGRIEASIEMLERIARALDGELALELRVPLVIGRQDQRDAAHALCTAAIRRRLERHGLVCAVEQGFVDGRLRGWIDLLAFDRSTGRAIVVEVKTQLRDVGGLLRQVGWYERATWQVARALGWRAREVCCLVAFLATDENDAALEAHRAMVDTAFPLRGRGLQAALDVRGPFDGWGLTLIDPRRRGDRIWVALRQDGRRHPAPYGSYADFMRTARTAQATRSRVRGASQAGIASPVERGNSAELEVRSRTRARTPG
jgi:transcriptional regulator with XRE-family HTH domain